jgi:hypothetical protein
MPVVVRVHQHVVKAIAGTRLRLREIGSPRVTYRLRVLILSLWVCHLILSERRLVKVAADKRRRRLITLVWYLVVVSLVWYRIGWVVHGMMLLLIHLVSSLRYRVVRWARHLHIDLRCVSWYWNGLSSYNLLRLLDLKLLHLSNAGVLR